MGETEREEKPCPACGETILAVAKKCKHCGDWLDGRKTPAAKRGPSGLFVLVALVVVVVGLLVVLGEPGSGRPSRTPGGKSSARAPVDLGRMDGLVREMIGTGVIHSVDVENNYVRCTAVQWLAMPLETKQQTVTFFSNYFDAKGSTGRVKVLSDRNDTVLAEYSVWTGIKIHQ